MKKVGASGKIYVGVQRPAAKKTEVVTEVLVSVKTPDVVIATKQEEPKPEPIVEVPVVPSIDDIPVNLNQESWKAKREKKKLLPYGLKEESSDDSTEAHQS